MVRGLRVHFEINLRSCSRPDFQFLDIEFEFEAPLVTMRVTTRVERTLLSFSRLYMYTWDNGVPHGLFRQFGLDLRTCFDVLAVRSEVQTEG